MSPKSVLITGANRGIGLELVKQFLKQASPPDHIFATYRDPAEAQELKSVAESGGGKVHLLRLEMTDHSAFESVKGSVEAIVGDDGLNLLIQNAAHGSLDLSAELMRESYEVNCIAPYFFTQAMLPLVKTASEKNCDLGMGVNRAAIVMVSSLLGSIGENGTGDVLAYRCSKAALNMAMKNISVDLTNDKILVMAIHPGWVQTRLGGPNWKITKEECCLGMLDTFSKLRAHDHGSFKTYYNTSIAW